MPPYLLIAGLVAVASPEPGAPDPLAYFQGAWTCAGHFEPSKKPLASAMVFSRDPDTGALLKQHRDAAPGTYKATETWSFARLAGGFRATIADGYSGQRWYASPGWEGDRWTWSRQGTGEPGEQFVYIRTGPASMTVDWMISRAGGPVVLGDTLACTKA
ncbi:MAG TPA: hypothetical protein VNZ85_16250 [Caulobacter sp.]|nr:hypothetical protein [Caulobacter sp.]